MISCIVLAAGLSERFGGPKALASLNNKNNTTHHITAIEHLLNTLIASDVDEIIVVLGCFSEEIKPYVVNDKKIQVVLNNNYVFGQTSSFKVGLEAVSDKAKGFLVVPVDCPFILKDTFNSLCQRFLEQSPSIIIPTYQAKKGHPPLFHSKLRPEGLELKDTEGLNEIAHHHSKNTVLLPVDDPGTVLSFNTREEFERIKNLYS